MTSQSRSTHGRASTATRLYSTAILAGLALIMPACAGPASSGPSSSPATPGASDGTTAPLAIDAAKVVDLTHPMYPEMPFWPGGVPFTLTRLVDYDQGYRLHKFEMGENTGTHVDAPSHFVQGKRDIDTIPASELVVPAVVIDIRDKAAADPDYQLSAEDVSAWESEHGPVPSGALVILNTGWHERFADPTAFVNMDETKVMHFPGYGIESARALLDRGVVGIATDTLSLDHGASKTFETHQLVLGADKYMIEKLANLNVLPATGATVIVGVLPVRGGSQAQARVLAILP